MRTAGTPATSRLMVTMGIFAAAASSASSLSRDAVTMMPSALLRSCSMVLASTSSDSSVSTSNWVYPAALSWSWVPLMRSK